MINVPFPTKETNPRQKSINVDDLFLTRFTPPWARPSSLPAQTWRAWVLNQPVAIVCRESLIANLLSLDWKITPKNSNYKEELNPVIKYYTRLFQKGGDYSALGLDYSGLVEWIAGDLLDTPFGAAAEIGRKGRSENGRVQWIRPLDAGTLFPTLNQEFPVVQYWQGWDAVAFRSWEISRVYMSPHSFIWKEGWGMAPPEKIYFAVDLLNRGDKYYANLLLDVPTAGILDLGDMEKSSAEEWITAFKTFVNDNETSFRVPVLYEHNNPVEFIPFGKVPNDIMFDRITLKYAALTAAAYGMSLSDIGLQTTSASGETLAGSIRQERRTRKTGFARVKAKVKAFFDHILPETIEFNFIDYDDELSVALGRARLASAQAFKTWQDGGNLSPQEVRSQIIEDGLVSISLPDELPPDAKPLLPTGPFGKVGGNAEPEMIGDAKPPSGGGEGEIRKAFTAKPNKNLFTVTEKVVNTLLPQIIDTVSSSSDDDILMVRSMISEGLFDEIDSLGLQGIIESLVGTRSVVNLKFSGMEDAFRDALGDEYADVPLRPYLDEFEAEIRRSINGFLGRTIAYLINASLSENDIANPADIQYTLMVETVKKSLEASLEDFIAVHINDEAQRVLHKIKEEN